MGLIKSIFFHNFKAIGGEPVWIDLAPVTLLFGPNSAGKSSIIQALHYMHEVFNRNNADADRTEYGGDAIELGGFRNMVHRHNLEMGIRFTFDLDLTDIELPEFSAGYVTTRSDSEDAMSSVWDERSLYVDVQIEWSAISRRPYVSEYAVNSRKAYQSMSITCSADGKDVQLTAGWAPKPPDVMTVLEDDEAAADIRYRAFIEGLLHDAYRDEAYGFRVPLKGTRDALPIWGQPLNVPWDIFRDGHEPSDRRTFVEQLSQIVVGTGQLIARELSRMIYVGPLREVPGRDIQPSRSPDPSRWSSGLAAWDLLAAPGERMIPVVNQWLSRGDRFNTGYSLVKETYREVPSDSPLGQALESGEVLDLDRAAEWFRNLAEHAHVRLFDQNKDITLAPQDLGVGLSQLIPVIVATLSANNRLVLIEQPELHLHPAAQVELGDLFIEAARTTGSTAVVETHSEHLLLRILRRIRETSAGSVPPGEPECRTADVAIYFIEADRETKAAQVTRLNVTEDGDFSDPWPHGFFEERDAELF